MTPEPPTYADLALPKWLWGGNPKRLVDQADLISRNNRSEGRYRVRTAESYFNQRPTLIRVTDIAGPDARPRYDLLSQQWERINQEIPPFVHRAIAERQARAEATQDPVDVFSHAMLALFATPVSELPGRVKEFHEILLRSRLEGDPGSFPFASSGVHLVQVDAVLHTRLKIASVALRLEQDQKMGSGDFSHVNRAIAAQEQAFASSGGLYDGIYLFDAYLGPLTAALSPAVWALNVARTFGNLIFTLGQPLAGTNGEAAELLQLVALPGGSRSTPVPTLAAASSAKALRWWADGLNDMFAVLSDPAVFVDRSGRYVPSRHLQAVLTVEQLFRRVTSLLLAHRDAHARRALFFTVLDTLEPLTGRGILIHCDDAFARRTQASVKEALPVEAAQVLMPAVDRGISALTELQEGFFIRRQLGSRTVDLRLRESARSLAPSEAAAQYLKTLRDATHGHGSNRQSKAPLTDALLAHHDGHVPHDLGLLAFLYLLDVLARPERLRKILRRSATT